MIYSKTMLSVTDNTGVKFVKCLRISRTVSSSGKRQVAIVGNIILVSIKVTKFLEKIKKGQLYKALIVRTVSSAKRDYGSLKFQENSVILLNKKMEPIGNRIFGPIAREALEQNFVKFASIRVKDL